MLASHAGFFLGDMVWQRHLINITPGFLPFTVDFEQYGTSQDKACLFAVKLTPFLHYLIIKMFCV